MILACVLAVFLGQASDTTLAQSLADTFTLPSPVSASEFPNGIVEIRGVPLAKSTMEIATAVLSPGPQAKAHDTQCRDACELRVSQCRDCDCGCGKCSKSCCEADLKAAAKGYTPKPCKCGCIDGKSCKCEFCPSVALHKPPAKTVPKKASPSAGTFDGRNYHLKDKAGIDWYGPDWPALYQHVSVQNQPRARIQTMNYAPFSATFGASGCSGGSCRRR
jgi:hypothetical protein